MKKFKRGQNVMAEGKPMYYVNDMSKVFPEMDKDQFDTMLFPHVVVDSKEKINADGDEIWGNDDYKFVSDWYIFSLKDWKKLSQEDKEAQINRTLV